MGWSRYALPGGVFALVSSEVIPVQTGGLNGSDRGSGDVASRPVRRMVVQSNS